LTNKTTNSEERKMKKTIAIFGVAALASCAFAQVVNTPRRPAGGRAAAADRKPIDPAERAAKKARIAKMEMEECGGRLVRPHSQTGTVFCVDAQNRIPKEWIDEVLQYFVDETRIKFEYKAGTFDFANPKVEGNATLFVVDDEKLPAILHAPENRWVALNAAVIAKEQRPAFFQARSKKQISRSLALLCGASNSQFPGALTRGIVKEEDLDKNIDYVLPIDVFNRFRTYMEPLGVRPAIYDTYDRACEQGWAPAPTNEIQKAIWDEVHALPANPIKIKPETKKVRD